VTNDLDQPATVLVTVRPLAPLIAVSQQNVVVEVKAHSQRKASIPVKSLSNGTVILVVSLSSPTGVRIGAPTSVSTSVRAGWEGPVTFGLAGAIAIVFAFGLWRALVRRRRNRDSATDDEDLE
jgi:protein-S-isoprenylcysteine O-methyltransferase Ste14